MYAVLPSNSNGACSFLLVIFVCFSCLSNQSQAQDRVRRIGDRVIATNSSINVNQTIFLLDRTGSRGVLFAFTAYLINTQPITLQVWRPATLNNATHYELIAEWPWQPIVTPPRSEDLYLNRLLTPGDGCVLLEPNDRLGLYVNLGPSPVGYTFIRGAGSLIQSLSSDPQPMTGDVVGFTSLPFPYRFSLRGWIDTDLDSYNISDVQCPTNLFVPITGIVEPPPHVDEAVIGATGDTGSTGPRGSVGQRGPVGLQGPPGPDGQEGMAGPRGPVGGTGYTGPGGATGQDGERGQHGYTGPVGPVGATGAVGPAGPPGPQSVTRSSCSWCSTLSDPYLVLGLLVWMTVLSLAFILYVIIHTCTDSRRKADAHKGKSGYGYSNQAGIANIYSEVDEGKTAF